ncbi:hypothetical protein AB0E96_00490 [Kitasatospora sp. NPDC036755]|uniref:hypothetical protein n=1 Tax=Kitasatospora sp. NPDC036755 TaxID=3154600 RepID=UPI0033D1973C
MTTAVEPPDLHDLTAHGQLHHWISRHHDLAPAEAAEAAAIVTDTLAGTWRQVGEPGETFPEWLSTTSPALLQLLADTTAQALRDPWTGSHQLRIARLTLADLATDRRLHHN